MSCRVVVRTDELAPRVHPPIVSEAVHILENGAHSHTGSTGEPHPRSWPSSRVRTPVWHLAFRPGSLHRTIQRGERVSCLPTCPDAVPGQARLEGRLV